MSKKNVLVTGGAGYIGSHVCKQLAKSGYTPVTYDNLQGGHEWAIQFGPFIKGDIQDTEKLAGCLKQLSPIAVFHLASSINVRESLIDPAKYYHNNVQGTMSVLSAMVASGCKNFIFSSTASIFGNPSYIPIDENHPKKPIHAYGKSKFFVEMMLEDFERAHGIRNVCLRYFNASGADKEGLIGEAHYPETHLIPLVIKTALGQKDHLDIHGNSYNTEDGTAIRDYIHVTDLADAHIKALEWLINQEKSLKVNLGTGKGHSIKQIIETVERISGKKVKTVLQPPSPDASCLIASNSLAKETLKWSPSYSSMENIILTALNWHKKNV